MGFSSGNACFPTQSEAAADWCSLLSSGDYAMHCIGCTGSSCTISYLDASGASAQFKTISKTVAQQTCTVPTPVRDAVLFSGAVISLWIAVFAAMLVVKMFRVPHADSF